MGKGKVDNVKGKLRVFGEESGAVSNI